MADGEEVPLLVPVIKSTMADKLADSPPEYPFFRRNGHIAPPGHNAPIQSTQGKQDELNFASGGGMDGRRDGTGNGKEVPEQIPALIKVGPCYNGRLAPGLGWCKVLPPSTTSNQILPAGTVSGTQGHHLEELISESQPLDPNISGRRFSPPPQVSDYSLLPMHKCFALASTRVYDKNLRCDRCGGRSDLGWYYRCCHEIDARLFESIRNGNKEHYDEIGESLIQDMQEPTRGPAARQDKLSLLNELPADQLDDLSAPQLAKVLRQREGAINTALADRYGTLIPPPDELPFLLPPSEECKASLCPSCGRGGGGEQQSFLNLDGVLKGDVPPTAAVGFGFRALGGRPVANANIVKNLGLRDPKTGLLPDQQAKIPAAESGISGDMNEEVKDAKLVGHAVALKVDDAETSEDSEGPKTPDSSQKADDSDEDFVSLYMDSEGNNADPIHDDAHSGHTEGNEN
ncbi:hypothetical protein N0V82_001166 [Gnomoniopsis sp. IMI 355080]|nr:hypothetical protein N0V82_001166 [Gnomoniopsis sp. IMI 355080]